MATVRHFAFYLDNKKAITINEVKYNLVAGRTPQFGAEGYLCHSQGAQMAKINASEATTVDGSDLIKLAKKVLPKGKTVQCSGIISGEELQFEMVVLEMDFDSNSKTGEAKGSVTLEGSLPDIG